MSTPRLSAALIVLALSGCAAVGPDFTAPAPAAPPDWSSWHGGAPELLEPALRQQSATLQSAFHDPALSALLARAQAASPDLQSAALRFAQSRLQRAVVAAQDGVQVGMAGSAQRQRQSETGAATRMIDALAPPNRNALIGVLSAPHELYQGGFDASWELDLWGRVRRAIEAADAGIANAAALQQQVQLSVASELARHYFELRGTQRQLSLHQADLTAAAEQLELLQARARNGISNELEATRQRTQLAELRAQLPALREQEAQSLNQITLLTGAAPGALNAELAARDEVPAALPELSLGLPSALALRRPDIQAALARLHGATAAIGLASADLYPRLTLGASAGLESLSGAKFGEWGSRQWSVGPNLQLPLFDQGRRRATVALRGLEQQEAAVAYQQTVLRAWHEVDSALNGYSAERQRNAQLSAREASSAAALALAQARHAGGLSDALPPLDAGRALLQARRDLARSNSALAQRLLAVYKALGVAPQ